MDEIKIRELVGTNMDIDLVSDNMDSVLCSYPNENKDALN